MHDARGQLRSIRVHTSQHISGHVARIYNQENSDYLQAIVPMGQIWQPSNTPNDARLQAGDRSSVCVLRLVQTSLTWALEVQLAMQD